MRVEGPVSAPGSELLAFAEPVGEAAASVSPSLDACGNGGVGLAREASTRGGGNSAAPSGDR